MGNKLRKIFNKNKISYKGSISFNDKNAANDFRKALNSVFESGKTVRVDGIARMSWGINNGSGILPIDDFGNVLDMEVGPSYDSQVLQIKVEDKNVDFPVESCQLEHGTIIRTPSDFPFEMNMFFNTTEKTVKLSCKSHIEIASNVEELLDSMKLIKGLFDSFFTKDPDDKDTDFDKIKSLIDTYLDLFNKLSYVEKMFGIRFDVKSIDLKDVSSYNDLNELCLSVRDKKALRLNARMTSDEGIEIHNESDKNLEIGKPLALTFLKEISYMIWGQVFKLYGAFYVGNAVVKDVKQLEDGKSRIMYGDNETNPMYLAYKGYVNEEEAKVELNTIMDHKEEYENAKTADQYRYEK